MFKICIIIYVTKQKGFKMVKLTKEITKAIEKEEYYSEESFINDCKTYIKAVESGRILYTVTHVSNSGMSRNINIKSFEGKMSKGYYRNYFMLLQVLGYKLADKWNSSDIKVIGCGMNMLFATNYDIIHALNRLGFINKKECDVLAQRVN